MISMRQFSPAIVLKLTGLIPVQLNTANRKPVFLFKSKPLTLCDPSMKKNWRLIITNFFNLLSFHLTSGIFFLSPKQVFVEFDGLQFETVSTHLNTDAILSETSNDWNNSQVITQFLVFCAALLALRNKSRSRETKVLDLKGNTRWTSRYPDGVKCTH